MVDVSMEHPDIQDALVPGGPGLPLVTSTEGLSAKDRAAHVIKAVSMLIQAEAMLGGLSEETIGDVIADKSLPTFTRDTLLSPSRMSSEVRERVVVRSRGIDATETTGETAETSGETGAEKMARISQGGMTPEERARATAILDATYHRAGKMAVAA